MTRENKLALIIGFALVLVVGILISDHFSVAATQETAELLASEPGSGEYIDNDTATLTPVPFNASNGDFRLLRPPSAVNGTHVNRGSGGASGGASGGPSGENEQGEAEFFDNPNLQAQRELEPAARQDDPDGYRWYSIKSGESLSKICQREYGDMNLYPKLAAFNADRIKDPDSVSAGVTIRIPTKSVLLGSAGRTNQAAPNRLTPAPSRTDRASGNSESKYIMYTIKANENLSEIAQKQLGTSRRYLEIYNLNKDVIKNPDRVREGMKIKLPRE